MTSIAIVRDETELDDVPRYSATTGSGSAQSTGKTVGEAIDALMSKLPAEESSGLAIVIQAKGDEFFTETKVRRLTELIEQSRTAPLSATDQHELEDLVEAELIASGKRAARLAGAFGV